MLVLAGSGSVVRAAGDPPADAKGAEPAPVVTEHTVTIGGEAVSYTATAGRLAIKDEAGKSKALIFHVAYERKGVEKPELRPIMFVFNGGPGSSSVWLHMGSLGPRRITYGDEGEAPSPPGGLIDNEAAWLDFTDLVFIDPVTTGYSRAAEGENAQQFHGLRQDAQVVGEFIRLYTTQHKRWLSPKFLAGESYGTTRAAALSALLQDELGMYLNGIVLISPVLEFQTIRFDEGNDEPYWLFLPTYTATAWYHKKLGADLGDLNSAVGQAEKWASTEYVTALAKGNRLSAEELDKVATQLARFTGLSKDYVKRSNLRISQGRFCKELLRDQGRTVGRLDSRYKGIDRDDAGSGTEYDPSYAVIQGPYTAGINAYVRGELGFESDLNYEILTGRVHPWDLGAEGRYAEVADGLRRAMNANPKLGVLVCNGYYDLATPHFASDKTVSQLGLDDADRSRVTIQRYNAGHMMYLRKDDRDKLRVDAKRFVLDCLK
ncbi:MAG: peptidase S10 [Phycisphaerales bacterium]|nr:peptidase S10 [Phycisphaerales bacterium]